MTEATMTTFDLMAEVTIAAARERVFAAWTEPAQLLRWYRMADDWETTEAAVDLRVDGTYRIGMRMPGEEPFVEIGTFLEVRPPERLVYTCTYEQLEGWEEQEEPTLVTVDFAPTPDGGTRVVVSQTGFATERERDIHASGWPHFLGRLTALVTD